MRRALRIWGIMGELSTALGGYMYESMLLEWNAMWPFIACLIAIAALSGLWCAGFERSR